MDVYLIHSAGAVIDPAATHGAYPRGL